MSTIPLRNVAHHPFAFSDVGGLISAVSKTRFATYRQSTDSDRGALQLYTWNTAVAASFHGPLQTLEITLRNAVHDVMSAAHGTRWFDTARLLRPAQVSTVERAVEHLRRVGKQPTANRVVSELPFGFWVALFANAYDTTIWRSDLYRIFARRIKNRQGLHETLDRLRTLRNRIAHHEPIFQRNLKDDYRRIRDVVELLSEPALLWLDHHSRLDALDVEPDAVLGF